jgi:N-acyl-D-amino-acid deacylase
MTDLILRGGNVIDGGGGDSFVADVAIADGRIVDIGRVNPSSAARVLDVSGAVVCPGFIDLHSHTDYTIFSAPGAITQATQGVTTLVTGNCGFSPFPIVPEYAGELRSHGGFLADGLSWDWRSTKEYADAVDRLPLGVNLALQVGHDALRIGAMGLADRVPTPDELVTMRSLLAQAAADGAVGFSTGLIYAPGLYASLEELVTLATEAAGAGLLYSTHMRNEGEQLLEAIDEALTTARLSGVRLEISHLKAAGSQNWGLVSEALALIAEARRSGVDVAADQYPYTASSTTLTAWLPGWALDGGTPELLRRLADPDESARIVGQLSGLSRELRADAIVLADTPEGPYHRFLGKSVQDVAAELGLSAQEAILELLRGQRGSVGIVNHTMSEDDVRQVMRHPLVSVASDSHTPGCPGRGRPHPRGLGTFTRVLGHYARDEGVLALPLAVRKMTGLPASRLGWSDRGVLRAGAVADIAVFDPATVLDQATFDDPWQLSTGLVHTLIAGTPVLEGGTPTGAAPGAVLRKTR